MKETLTTQQPSAEKYGDIKNILTDLYSTLPVDELIDMQDEVVAKGDFLRKKYPDIEDYRVMHILSGSTVKEGHKVIEEDLKGEDSIVDFINMLAHKYSEVSVSKRV